VILASATLVPMLVIGFFDFQTLRSDYSSDSTTSKSSLKVLLLGIPSFSPVS